MLISLKMVLRELVLPPASLLLLALVGVWLLARNPAGRARRAGFVLMGSGLGLLWILSTAAVGDQLQRFADRAPPLDLARARGAQAIVILSGGEANSSAPEYAGAPAAAGQLLERLAYGAYVARHTGLPVLVTGDFYEARAMRAVLVRDFGITPRWIDNRSRDTFENAEYSAALLRAAQVSRIVLVTSASHAYRATREFESVGLGVIPAPVGVWTPDEFQPVRCLPSSAGLDSSTEALYELIGDLVRRASVRLHLRRHAPWTEQNGHVGVSHVLGSIEMHSS